MQDLQKPFPCFMSVQGMRYRRTYDGTLTQRFASGPKQVILRHVLYVDRRFCNKLVEAELVFYLKYHVAQSLILL